MRGGGIDQLTLRSEIIRREQDHPGPRVRAMQNPPAFVFASAELKGDREFMMEAVKQYAYWALYYASAELKGDR